MAVKNMVKVGQKVTFGRAGETKRKGTVIKTNPKTAHIKLSNGDVMGASYGSIQIIGSKKKSPSKKARPKAKKNPPSRRAAPLARGEGRLIQEAIYDLNKARTAESGIIAFASKGRETKADATLRKKLVAVERKKVKTAIDKLKFFLKKSKDPRATQKISKALKG